MRDKRVLMRLFALLFAFVLVAAACGDDDGDEDTTDTTEASDDGSTTEGGGDEPDGGGAADASLAGWRGTTPLPETSDAVTEFQARLTEQDPELQDFNYGPESYDAVIVTALAAQIAGDDGSAHAAEIVNVTTGGEKCTTYADCLALIEGGTTDIDYDGISGPHEFSGNGEPTLGSYGILQFGEDNRIDDSLTEFKTIEGPPELADIPLSEVEVDRAGDGVLKFGTLLPETGSLAFLGPPEVAGVEVAVAEINENGGFNGADVELTLSDSGDTTTDIASQSVARLQTENVDAIIGAASSSVTLSVIDDVVNAGITMFSPANTSATLSDYDDKGLYFRNAPPDVLQGQVLAEVVAEDGYASAAIINLDDAYGNGLAEFFEQYFTEAGGEVTTTVAYQPDAQTFEAEVNEIVGTDPDAIIVIGFEESARIVSELIKQGSGPADVPIYGTDGNMGNATGETFEAEG